MRARSLFAAALAFGLSAVATAGYDDFFLGNGQDGPVRFGNADFANFSATVSAPIAPGDSVLNVGASSPTGSLFFDGQLVLIHQSTGIVPTPDAGLRLALDLSGDPVGRFELARIRSALTPNSLELTEPVRFSYAANATQVTFIPEYTDVLIADAGEYEWGAVWNGSLGGITGFLASGTVTIESDSSIHADAVGFRGGRAVADPTLLDNCAEDSDQAAPRGAQKGEGISSTRFAPAASTGQLNEVNGAGGGICQGGGGGGGGHFGLGGFGGKSVPVPVIGGGGRDAGGYGGSAIGYSPLDHLLFGGGGGAAHGNVNSSGGVGGGIVFIRAGSVAGSGQIRASGARGFGPTGAGPTGTGGGGAGGSVYLRTAGPISCTFVSALGGDGGTTTIANASPGGGGAGGLVFVQGSDINCALLSSSGLAGRNGGGLETGATPTVRDGPGQGTVLVLDGGIVDPPVPFIAQPIDLTIVDAGTIIEFAGTRAGAYPLVLILDGLEYSRLPAGSSSWSFTSPTAIPPGHHVLAARTEWQELYSRPAQTRFIVLLPDGGLADGGFQLDGGFDAGNGNPDGGPDFDAGVPDAGVPDAGVPDAGVPDAGVLDAGVSDAGANDAGEIDAGVVLDAGVVDGGVLADAGELPDAGPFDAGAVADAGPVDAGIADAGRDAGAVDAGRRTDAGRPDAGDAGEDPEDFSFGGGNGCGCSGTSGAFPLFGLAALAASLMRRRRTLGSERSVR